MLDPPTQRLNPLFFHLALIALPFATPAQAIPAPYPQESFNDPAGSPDDNSPPQDPNVAGASGSSKASITLSTAAIIVIAVVVGIVVVLGIGSAVLFYIAKKRQWELRKSIRKSARRVTTAIKSATPMKSNFSRRETGMMRIDPPMPRDKVGNTSRQEWEKSRAANSGSNAGKRAGGVLKPAPSAMNMNPSSTDTASTGANRDAEKKLGMYSRAEEPQAPAPSRQQQSSMGSFEFGLEPPSRGSRRSGTDASSSGVKESRGSGKGGWKAGSWFKNVGGR